MQRELRRIHDEIGGTFIVVTHDQSEALSLADHVAVMRDGEIEQIGGPSEIYDNPVSQFVSTFIGEANFLSGYRRDGVITLDAGLSWGAKGEDGRLVCMIRPENIQLGPGADCDILIPGRVIARTYQGPTAILEFEISAGSSLKVIEYRDTRRAAVALGEEVVLGWSVPDMRVFASRGMS